MCKTKTMLCQTNVATLNSSSSGLMQSSKMKRSGLSSLMLTSLTIEKTESLGWESSSEEESSSIDDNERPTLKRGWGSAESRQAYSDLANLSCRMSKKLATGSRRFGSESTMETASDSFSYDLSFCNEMEAEVDSWGYFVDSTPGITADTTEQTLSHIS